MSATSEGGKKTAKKLLAEDPDYYRKRGREAQKAWKKNGKKPRGFAFDRDLARKSGAIGGRISRRTK
jgi:hypothetical protein